MIEMVEAATAMPHDDAGPHPRGRRDGRRLRDDPPARRRLRGASCPFNFPAMVPMWFLPFAIACGNTFILKPSEQVPMTQALVWEIDRRGRRPAAGRDQPRQRLGRRRQRDPRLARDRRHLVRRLGQGRAVHLRARGGRTASACRRSAAPRTTWSSCPTPSWTRPSTTSSAPRSARPASAAWPARSIVTVGDAKKPLLERCCRRDRGADRRRRHGRGRQRRPGRLRAPRATASSGWIDKGVEEGATRAPSTGASRRARPDGAFVGPTIIDDVTPDMEVAREEIFGPVLSVHPRRVARARDRDRQRRRATATARRSSPSRARPSAATATTCEVGMVGVNIGVAAPVAFFPFSGWKDSFFGDLHAHGTRRGRLLHAQEDGHVALLLGRGDRQVLHRAGGAPLMARPSTGRRGEVRKDDRAHVFHSWSAQGLIDPLAVAAGRGLLVLGLRGQALPRLPSQLVNTNIGHQHPKVVAGDQGAGRPALHHRAEHANDKRGRAGRDAGRARARRPRHGVLHQRRRRGERERDAHGAHLHTGRHKVLVHVPLATTAATQRLDRRLTGDPRRWAVRAAAWPASCTSAGPYPYRSSFHATTPRRGVRARARAPRGDPRCTRARRRSPAIMLESIVGTNGILVPPDGYLQGAPRDVHASTAS